MEEYLEIMKFVERGLAFDNSGHGISHAKRVFSNSKKILKSEG